MLSSCSSGHKDWLRQYSHLLENITDSLSPLPFQLTIMVITSTYISYHRLGNTATQCRAIRLGRHPARRRLRHCNRHRGRHRLLQRQPRTTHLCRGCLPPGRRRGGPLLARHQGTMGAHPQHPRVWTLAALRLETHHAHHAALYARAPQHVPRRRHRPIPPLWPRRARLPCRPGCRVRPRSCAEWRRRRGL